MNLKDAKIINEEWKFICEDCSNGEFAQIDYRDEGWDHIELPHDWDTYFAPKKENRSGAGGGYAHAGIGWYRKKIKISKDDLLKHVELIFEGIYMESEIYINGLKAGSQSYGYSTFVVDITDKLVEGDNLISVRVNNSKQPNSRWYTGSGIYRDVYIRKISKLCLDYYGVKVETAEVSDDEKMAILDVKSSAINYEKEKKDVVIKWQLLDKKGQLSCKAGATLCLDSNETSQAATRMFVQRPILWEIDKPYLYTFVTQVFCDGELLDERRESVGIRTIAFSCDEGFKLNGEKIKIKGVCLHHDSGLFGSAFYKDIWEKRLDTLKDMGVNGIRCSHNPPAPGFLDLCDSMGFVVMDEICDEWMLGKNKNENYFSEEPSYGFSQFFCKDVKTELQRMIRRDYNHPSVILWSIGNEIPEQAFTDGPKIAKFLSDIVHEEDSIRLTTSACDNIASLPGIEAKQEFMNEIDVVGYNYVGRWRERAERFYEDDKLSYPDRIMIGSENPSVCGDRGDYSQTKDFNDNYITASLTHEALWRFTASRDYVAGDFIWTGIDYLGESHWPRRGANFGAIDTAGFKKDAFYYFRSIWNDKDITLHLLPHWNFEGEEGTFKTVICYTNCERVKLYINDKLISEKVSAPCPRYGAMNSWDDELRRFRPTTGDLHLTWDVPYEPGVLRAEGYMGDKVVKTCEVVTTKKPSSLEASVEKAGEFYLVEITARDEDGRAVPDVDSLISVVCSDNVEFIGMDAGNMQDLSGYKSDKRNMLAGKLLAAFKKKNKEETGSVLLSSEGLNSVNIEF